jgi:uncharacterized protein (DUF1697 family)
MTTYVILLRAVNLAGYGKLSMADFRKLLTKLGFENVQTYIQSGNAVVDASGTGAQVAKAVETALEKLMGAAAGAVVRTHEQLAQLVRENPFRAEAVDGTKVHVGFLAAKAAPGAAEALEQIVARYPNRRDRYHLAGEHIYFHLPDGAAETKFTGKTLDKAVGTLGTGRNWNTVMKLHEMSKR